MHFSGEKKPLAKDVCAKKVVPTPRSLLLRIVSVTQSGRAAMWEIQKLFLFFDVLANKILSLLKPYLPFLPVSVGEKVMRSLPPPLFPNGQLRCRPVYREGGELSMKQWTQLPYKGLPS